MDKRKILAYGKLALICLGVFACLGILATMALTVQTISPAAAEEPAVELPIIMYHSILNSDAKAGKYVITPKTLEEDFAYLKAHGYTAVTISDLIAYQEGRKELPQKPIMITFDDGYYNNYSYAFPLLKKYDMKAVISVIGRYTDEYSASMEKMNNNYSQLTWDQIQEMMDSGYVEFANHSYDMHSDTTRRGVKKKYQEATGEYRMAITQDIGQMQAEMKEETGWEPVCFTYPFGFINDEAQEIIREMGFKASLSSYEYVNRITKDPECLFELGRYNRASGESMGEFMAKMTDVR